MALTAAARGRRRPFGRSLRAVPAPVSATAAVDAAGEQPESTRRLLASWLAHPQPIGPGQWTGGGLAVPPAEADTVIETARELARDASPAAEQPAPPAGLLRLAEVMVVSEHPSVSGWTAAERRLAASWIAVLLDRQGEDGVQRLVHALCAAPVATCHTNPVRLSCVDPECGPGGL